MQIRLINNIEELMLIRFDWNKLFQQGNYSPFQSFEFNYYSWNHELINNKENKLAITLITYNKGIQAIFPFYIDSNNRLRFINDSHFDFCDFISNEPVDFLQVYSFLKREVKFNIMSLINIKKEGNIYKAVKGVNKISKTVELLSEYSVLRIEKGVFPYNVPHYRSHQKHRINKAIRKNQEKQSIIASFQDYSFPKQEILLLKENMISSGIRDKHFLTQDRLLLIECLYNSGIIILNIMKSKQKIHAINILLKSSSSEFMFWIDLFDDSKMVNISSYINFIRVTSLEEIININFGRGRYFYKYSNFSPDFYQLYQVHIFSKEWQKLCFQIVSRLRSVFMLFYKKIRR